MKTKKLKFKTKNYNSKLKTFLILSYRFAFCVLSFALLSLPAKAAITSNVEPTSITNNSMIITWTTTDEAGTTEILYGIGSLTETTSAAGTTKYHYLEITGLYPNTTYQYKIKSNGVLYPPNPLPPLTFKTLEEPGGEYLFSFAVLNGIRYAEGKANSKGARGIPYEYCDEIISSEVTNINQHNVAFTVINGNLADSTYGDQAGTNLKTKLENLNGAADL
ncbi:MAG: fibronectin type III domain-containing protein, partial [Candidatus Margulisbacteria bacterium]|nr:fibronectin type III domain-containing protein [Candidatus Margulisiibacteriota bacterium]